MRRTLTVILASDVSGYSRLVAENEEDTIQRFRQAAGVFADLVKKYQGTIFNTAGDAILARFDSAVDAARCAIDIQDANNGQNAQLPDERKLLFRIGIAIGDVLVAENGDLLGDAVNVAARLEGLAEPGGICISEDVHDHVLNKIRISVVDLGNQSLKNIPRAVRVFRLLPGTGDEPQAPARKRAARRPITWLVSGTALLVLVAAAVGWRFYDAHETAGIEQPFDASKVPFVTDRVRKNLADYRNEPDFKALAISREASAIAVGLHDTDAAQREALGRCEQRDQKGYCRIYAVGNNVVWTRQMLPMPVDMRTELLTTPFTAEHRQRMPWVTISPDALERHLKGSNHKALAVSRGGFWSTGNRTSAAEAARLAVERCTDVAQATCLLVTLDGFLTVDFPSSYRAVQPFTLTGEAEMSEADKQRIAEIYSGKDWRALARGSSKAWYAVAGKASETDAVDDVLKTCQQQEQKCSLYAIGNFRVGDKIK